MAQERESFATLVDSDILAAVNVLAEREGRAMESIVDEALGDLLNKHSGGSPNVRVMEAYLTSHEKFGRLYKKLAE